MYIFVHGNLLIIIILLNFNIFEKKKLNGGKSVSLVIEFHDK